MRGRPRGRPVEGSAGGGDAVTDAAQAGAETEDQPGGGAGLQHKLSTSGLYRHQIPVIQLWIGEERPLFAECITTTDVRFY